MNTPKSLREVLAARLYYGSTQAFTLSIVTTNNAVVETTLVKLGTDHMEVRMLSSEEGWDSVVVLVRYDAIVAVSIMEG